MAARHPAGLVRLPARGARLGAGDDEIDDEERFYGAGVTIQVEVPDTYVMIRLANPRHFSPRYDLKANVIPSVAIAIPLAS